MKSKFLPFDGLADELSKWVKTGTASKKLKNHISALEDYETSNQAEQEIFRQYSSMYEEARDLERQSKPDEALEIYLKILSNYDPQGTAYYERPCIILEKQKRYQEAIDICNRAIAAIKSNKDFHASTDDFEKRLKRLENKINKQQKM